MEIKCELVQDLLPLYLEGLCKEETVKAVEEHLKTCPFCTRDMKYMSGDLKINVDVDEVDIISRRILERQGLSKFQQLIRFLQYMVFNFRFGVVLMCLVIILSSTHIMIGVNGRSNSIYLDHHVEILKADFVNSVNRLGWDAGYLKEILEKEGYLGFSLEDLLITYDMNRNIKYLITHSMQYDLYLQHHYKSYEPVDLNTLKVEYETLWEEIRDSLISGEPKEIDNAINLLGQIQNTLRGDYIEGYFPKGYISSNQFKNFIEHVITIGGVK